LRLRETSKSLLLFPSFEYFLTFSLLFPPSGLIVSIKMHVDQRGHSEDGKNC
jgi:hypothetical protein